MRLLTYPLADIHPSGPAASMSQPAKAPSLRRDMSGMSGESFSSTGSHLEASIRRLYSSVQHFQEIYLKYASRQEDPNREYLQNLLQALEHTAVADPVDMATALQTIIEGTTFQKELSDDDYIPAEWVFSFLKKLYPMAKFVFNVSGSIVQAIISISLRTYV